MSVPLLHRLFVGIVSLLAPLVLAAGELDSTATPVLGEAQLGLRMSLSTSGYEFYVAAELAEAGDETHAPWTDSPVRESFTASALLANFSATDVPFTFPDPVAAARHFKFRVFDSAGAQVWESDAGETAPQVEATAVLPNRGNWRSVARVPLKVDGHWLAPGRYTVEASVAGEIGATAPFEVLWPPLDEDTGIKGQVLQYPDSYVRIDGTVIAPAVMPYGVKATVRIEQIPESNVALDHPPFIWSGTTDEAGHFKVVTPPGRFWVSAKREGAKPPVNDPIVGPLFPIVTVASGQFTEQEIGLPGQITYEPPHADTGIRGQVKIDAGLAGVRVRISRAPSRYGGAVLEFPKPFVWEGLTDLDGRFQANTPPGQLRVTVARPGPASPFVVAASVDVTVVDGKFSDVEVILPRPIPPPSPNARRVTSVGRVTTDAVGAGGEILRIDAQGTVPTRGWRRPQLRARPSIDPTVLEFDFVAEPPKRHATLAVTDVATSLQIPWPEQVGTIRVHSKTNTVTLFRLILLGGQQGFGSE